MLRRRENEAAREYVGLIYIYVVYFYRYSHCSNAVHASSNSACLTEGYIFPVLYFTFARIS